MRPAILIVFVFAILITGVAALLVNRMMSDRAGNGQAGQSVITGNVLVAAGDIPAGTILQSKHFKWQFWPEGSRDESYVLERRGEDSEKDFLGSVVRRGLSAGEPITTTKLFKRGDAGFLSGALNPGMRAVSISSTAESSAAGFALPGDRVDVILTQQLRRGRNDRGANVASETILRNIRVLAVDQLVNDVEAQAKVGKTVTLEVTAKQAEILALAKRMGRLSLALRSLTPGPADNQTSGPTSDIEISEALALSAPTPLGQPALAPAAVSVPKVLVASRDLKAGSFLRDIDFKWQRASRGAFVDNLITDTGESRARLHGALIVSDVAAGERIGVDKIIAPTDSGFVSAALRPGQRAVTLDREAVAGIAEFVSPGDRVDVVLTQQLAAARGGMARHTSETIVQNVRLIAINPRAGSAALEVSAKEAATLSVARQMGRISLALRSASTGVGESAASANDTDVSSAFGRDLAALKGPPPASKQRVLVAAGALEPGRFLRDSDLRWAPVADGAPHDGEYLEGEIDRTKLRGALTRVALASGAPLRQEQLILPGDAGYLAAALHPGKRAITIGKDAVAGIAGFVTPGDRVDVVLTQKVVGESGGQPRHISETILQDVRLLARDARAGTAALEVTAREAAEIAVAQRMGEISLALRSGAVVTGVDGAATARDTDVSSLYGTRDAPAKPSAAHALIVSQPLAAGDFLRDEVLSWKALPPGGSAANGYILETKENNSTLRGALVRHALEAGAFVRASDLLRADEPGFVTAALAPGMRAVTLDRDAVAGISPFVSPGDRVDVVLTQALADANSANGGVRRHTSETILQDIRLLAFDRTGGTAALEVSPQDAASLSVARRMGQISLVLRSVGAKGAGALASARDSEVSAAFGAGLVRPSAAPAPQPSSTTTRAAAFSSRVLVVSHDVQKGKLLRDTDLQFASLPQVDPNLRYFVEDRDKPKQVRGALVQRTLKAGEPVHSDILVLPSEPGFLAEVLSTGMRAVSIAVNAVSGVSGYISPDDRVDVLLTQAINDLQGKATPDPILDPRRFAETIMQGVRVIAIKQTIDETSGQPVASSTVTLEVPPQKAETLALAATMGDLSLALRGGRPGEHPDIGVTYTSDIGISNAAADLVNRARVLNRSRGPKPVPAAAGRAPVAPPPVGVKVYRGARSQTVEF